MSPKFDKITGTAPVSSHINLENSDVFFSSLKGSDKKVNQDRFVIHTLKDNSLLVAVADGMGGEVSGDYAAELATSDMSEISEVPHGNKRNFLNEVFRKTDKKISDISNNKPEYKGMGTTMLCSLIKDSTAYWAHVGDCRLYLFRDGNLKQMTQDQTFGRYLLEEGEITEEELRTHYSQHILDQCIGHGEAEPETGSFILKKNDQLILSSDGLHKKLGNDVIESVLKLDTLSKSKIDCLIHRALDAGENDDITVLVVDLSEP